MSPYQYYPVQQVAPVVEIPTGSVDQSVPAVETQGEAVAPAVQTPAPADALQSPDDPLEPSVGVRSEIFSSFEKVTL